MPETATGATIRGVASIARREIVVDGVRVLFLERGERRERPSLIMLHGLVASAESFLPVIDLLPEDWHVIAIDNVPAAKRLDGEPCDVSVGGFARRMIGFCESLGLQEPVFLGHSHGGMISMQTAMEFRVSGLILMCPAHPYSKREAKVIAFYRSFVGRWFARVAPYFPLRLQRISIEGMLGPGHKMTPGRLRSYQRSLRRPGLVRVVERIIQSWWADMDILQAQLDQTPIEVPALLLWGEKDRLVPVWTAPKLMEHLAQAELVPLQGVGHLPNDESPGACAEAIIRWAEHHGFR